MNSLFTSIAAFAALTAAASAADLPRRAEPPVFAAPLPFTWTGVYIGTHTAYTFSDSQRITTTGLTPGAVDQIAQGSIPATLRSRSMDDLANFGGGFGINYQFTPGSGFVVGAAIDADWTDLNRNTIFVGVPLAPGGAPITSVYSQELGWLATANGRLGYAFDRFLVYGTGGAAIGHIKYGYAGFEGADFAAQGGGGGNAVGYNYGGGIEYAIPRDSFLGNLNILQLLGINLGGTTTLKAEYIHYDLGSRNVPLFAVGTTDPGAAARFKTEGNMVRAGFSYKFP